MKNQKTFTLIELIVVIAILATLATIAALTISNKVASSKDAVRITNIKLISKALNLQYVDKWYYPMPDDAKSITSPEWATVYYYWTFWENAAKQVETINEAPKDPETNQYFAYAVTPDYKSFQVATNLDKLDLWFHFIPVAYAAKKFVKVIWNFKNYAITTKGPYLYLWYLPSLIIVDTDNKIIPSQMLTVTSITGINLVDPKTGEPVAISDATVKNYYVKIENILKPDNTVLNFISQKWWLWNTTQAEQMLNDILKVTIANLKACSDWTPSGIKKVWYEKRYDKNCDNYKHEFVCMDWKWWSWDNEINVIPWSNYFDSCTVPPSDMCFPDYIENWWYKLYISTTAKNGDTVKAKSLITAPDWNKFPRLAELDVLCNKWTRQVAGAVTSWKKINSCAELANILWYKKDGWYLLRDKSFTIVIPTYCDFMEDSSGKQPTCDKSINWFRYQLVKTDGTIQVRQKCVNVPADRNRLYSKNHDNLYKSSPLSHKDKLWWGFVVKYEDRYTRDYICKLLWFQKGGESHNKDNVIFYQYSTKSYSFKKKNVNYIYRLRCYHSTWNPAWWQTE